MEKTIKVINDLKQEGIISDYAIGGAVASIFYIEPVTTYVLDIFVILKEKKKLVSLTPIYEWFEKKGYIFDKEHIIIEGIPVQFIPVYNELIEDSVSKSVSVNYGKTKTKVLTAEYLVAILLDTFRAKDKERILRFLEEYEIDFEKLEPILNKYNLIEKFKKLKQ